MGLRKLKTSRWGDDAGFSTWALDAITGVLTRGRGARAGYREVNAKKEQIGRCTRLALEKEEGARSQGKQGKQLSRLDEARRSILSRVSRGSMALSTP